MGLTNPPMSVCMFLLNGTSLFLSSKGKIHFSNYKSALNL